MTFLSNCNKAPSKSLKGSRAVTKGLLPLEIEWVLVTPSKPHNYTNWPKAVFLILYGFMAPLTIILEVTRLPCQRTGLLDPSLNNY